MLVLPPKRETESGKGWDQERGEALKHPSTLNEHDSGGPLCEIQRVSQKKKKKPQNYSGNWETVCV